MAHSLAKKIAGQIVVAYTRVAAPGYTIYPEDYANGETPPDGWKYFPYEATEKDFAEQWSETAVYKTVAVIPDKEDEVTNLANIEDGAEIKVRVIDVPGYRIGSLVEHNNILWTSQIDGNTKEPGTSGWVSADIATPEWIQPTGSTDAYVAGATVMHVGKLWTSLVQANVWEPGVSGWREELPIASDITTTAPEWVQPTGAHDAYQIDDVVSHNGYQWKSTEANNVWEPGVFGWVVI